MRSGAGDRPMDHMTMEQAKSYAVKAKKFISEHKQTIAELTKAGEALGAPLALGLIEGRLARDGSGHIAIAGVPLMLLAGGVGAAGAASGYLEEYGVHAGNMAAGFLGSYGGDLGRKIGLKMRAKAGYQILAGTLAPADVQEIQAYWTAKNITPKAIPADAGYRVGLVDMQLPSQYVTIGAAPAPLSASQLEQMVREASST
jgi:hypothetical protein